jgi:hypothetical protein
VIRAKAWSFVLVGLVAASCTEKKEPLPRATPKPLAPLEPVRADAAGATEAEDPLHRIVPLEPVGPKPPEHASVVTLDGDRALFEGRPLGDPTKLTPPVLLVPVNDTYLVQVAPLLAALDDAGLEVWLEHPDADIAYPVKLRDEAAFRAWLEEPVPGKLRVIHREDGFELQTNMGKLHGGDPNGPTVPVRGGRMDLATLRKGLQTLQARFTHAPDYCILPSFGMELAQTARAMAPNYLRPDEAFFPQTCLVYPRPPAPDGGR